MICVVDYGVGNLFSLKSSFSYIGAKIVVSSRKEDIVSADKIVLPGVGAFEDAKTNLQKLGLEEVLKEQAKKEKKPFLGICLGMQLLFDRSFENGNWTGLGLISGDIVPFKDILPSEYKIPHIGWNPLKIQNNCELLKNIESGDCVYFVHSYYAKCESKFICASAEYFVEVPGVVQNANILGCQFHPEKSSSVGLEMLKNFVNI